MRHFIKLAGLAVLLMAQSCDSNETEAVGKDLLSPKAGLTPSDFKGDNHDCATVSQFGPNSYWTETLVNTAETNFLIQQNNSASNLFGLANVPLYFAGGPGTFNALSYGPPNNFIIWGEDMMRKGLEYGRPAVAYIAAHEVAHQVQFRQGYPSVRGNSNTELEADGFAGYYLRKRYTSTWSNVSAAYNFSQTIGGANGSSHGTPAQRRSALRLGWLLGQYDLTNQRLDYNFFYYYNSYVLPGKGKAPSGAEKPAGISKEIHEYIMTKITELQEINNGEISEEEFTKLN
ncbi:Elastase precursor [Tenacibaculum litopenaei]|uniref:metalloprotease n=1 Tax=Tenacibaculum litopenaei TaxID=396016 RepID=UPI00389613BD